MVTRVEPTTRERWLPLELCGRKLGISLYMVKKIVRVYDLQTRPNPFDKRSRMVDLYQVRKRLRDIRDI